MTSGDYRGGKQESINKKEFRHSRHLVTVELITKKSKTGKVFRLGNRDQQNPGNKCKCGTCCDQRPKNYSQISENAEQLLTN